MQIRTYGTSGPLVVVLHGGPGAPGYMAPVARGLADWFRVIFQAIKPISKPGRIEQISLGVRSMPSEEAYYWFSKCTAGANALNAQRALRVLLAGV